MRPEELYYKLDSFLTKSPRRTFLIFSALIALATVYYCWWVNATNYTGEAEMYNFAYADAIFNGVAPFTPYGDLRWEYPPLAYLTFLLPRLFTDNPETYVYLFGIQSAVFCIIGVWLFMKIADKLGRSPTPILIAYVVSIFALNYFIFDRFDIIVAVLVVAALYLYVQKKYSWATFLIVIGMFIKLYPAILIPVMLIPMLTDGRYHQALKQLALFVILAVVIMVPFIMMAPDNVWNFMSYHSERGIQIESLASSIILMFELYGFTSVNWDNSFGSYNLNGGIADDLVPYMMPLMAIMIVFAYILFYLWCRGRSEDDASKGAVFFSVILILFFILFNKVFSAQYVIWITLPMLMAYAYTKDTPTFRMVVLVMVMNILTYAMVKTSSDLMNVEALGIWLLFLRNMLVIGMTLVICRDIGALDGLNSVLNNRHPSNQNTE